MTPPESIYLYFILISLPWGIALIVAAYKAYWMGRRDEQRRVERRFR